MRLTISSSSPGRRRAGWSSTPEGPAVGDGDVARFGVGASAGGTLGAGGAGLFLVGCGCGCGFGFGGGGTKVGFGDGFGDGLGEGLGALPVGWMKISLNMISAAPPQQESELVPPAAPIPICENSEFRMFARCSLLFMNAVLIVSAALDSGADVQPMFSPAVW